MKQFAILFLLTYSLLLVGCGKSDEAAASEEAAAEGEVATNLVTLTPAQVQSVGITTVVPSLRPIKGNIAANGVLDVPPQNMVSIAATFGGFLKATPLLQGTRVSKGQLIATLEHPDFVTMQQEFLENKSQLEYLASEYQRQRTLAEEKVNAGKTLEKAKADYEGLKARMAGQRAKLEMLHIDMAKLEAGTIAKEVHLYSPINGYVTQMNVNIGSNVTPADVLFRIADTGHLHAELTVYEQDIPRLAIGQKVAVQIGNEKEVRMGTIHLLGREVDADRSIKAHVHFDEEDRLLIPGTYLHANIEVSSQEVLALPVKAILNFEGKPYVFVERAGASPTYELVEVEAGLQDGEWQEVRFPSGIGDVKVVEGGAYTLLAKLKNAEEEE
jgi:membrane fusion protein, heavy metal efflux system